MNYDQLKYIFLEMFDFNAFLSNSNLNQFSALQAGNTMKEKTRDQRDQFEQKVGIKFNEGQKNFLGFLTNFKTKSFRDKLHDNQQRMAVLCFFQSEEGELIKCMIPYRPYFYVGFEKGMQKQVQSYLQSKVEKIESIKTVQKVDLEQINHLSGRKKSYLKINFRTVKDLTTAKPSIKGIIDKRRKRNNNDDNIFYGLKNKEVRDITDFITDIREYDVTFHSRVCIDLGLRAGKWFDVELEDKIIKDIKPAARQRGIPELKILSYDIQTAKDPLKFPDSQKDEVMMISLMYEGEAFLIVNRGFCGDDVKQFDYQPKPEFSCHVTVFNEPSQKHTLLKFAQFIQSYNPNIITSYNGDRFDYPYLKRRFELNYIKFTAEMGVTDHDGQYYGSHISHLDCFYWVERDAFLPQGSRGLKAVTKAKLNYDPIQVDPEDMVWLAKNNTQRLAQYSISDSVATFFLYMKHIHGFIFALASIIPMFPDEVLRKGSGTLCQNLLMAQAYNRQIIFPNKKIEDLQKFYNGNLLDSQTYTGGKVQCLRTGVYRADFGTDFTLQPQAFQDLIQNVDEIIKFAVGIEMPQQDFNSISNLNEVRNQVITKLQNLRDVKNPHKHQALPLIYHIDVAAMYPNIILTNRLQPVAIVNDQTCSGCLFNQPQNRCKRQLQWQWRGSTFPLNEGQYLRVKDVFKSKSILEGVELQKAIKAQVKAYSQRVYKKTHIQLTQTRSDIVCMRENSFYVDTVRAFRDRRYEYKHLAKTAQKTYKDMIKAKDNQGAKDAQGMMILYESMQLAHKIILNSFYGYVMRKGARWYSMQMAAMVTYLGSNIISDSKNYIEGRIGKPLQLDTDGIWMLLPAGFPEEVKINFKTGRSIKLSYPCHILNHLIYDKYANDQYQWLENDKQWKYGTRKQMTIFFEIDGPYKAMMIPAAKEKQKTTQLDIQEHNTQMLKKRYVVFNFNNKIKEFKGFEMKRRGQLRITKVFQEEIFPQYLKGASLQECYAHCAQTAKKYLAIIQKQGQAMDTHQILDYLQQSRVLSRELTDYGTSKGVALSSARRLAQFLGPQIVKGKGRLCCYFVISRYPQDRPVAQRAIPTQIFDAQMQVQKQFLIKWTRHDGLLKGDVDIRKILDWNYYFQRLSTQVQKMVCIPAVLQGISNPVPQIQLPQWLQKKTFDMRHHRQLKLLSFMTQPKATPHHLALTSARKEDISAIKQKKQNLEPSISKNQVQVKSNHKQNKFSMMKNFKAWLGDQKRIWKEKKIDSSHEIMRNGETKSILQIIPQKTPGNFNVWYWSTGRIQQLALTMKRRYYTEGKGNKKAPRQQGDVIEVVAQEDVFVKQKEYFEAFIQKKFYETRLPLMISLVMKKGNLWKTGRNAMTYNQEDIQQVFGDYLPNFDRSPLPVVYLVHEKVLAGRSIWAIIIPKFHENYFAFVDKSKGANHDQLLMLARKTLKQREGGQSQKISIESFSEEKQAGMAINKKLSTLLVQLKQKFLIILKAENIKNVKQLGVSFLEQEGPVLLMNRINVQKPQILDWKKKSLKAVLQDSETKHEIDSLIMWARYSQIPLCNLQRGAQLLDNITNIQLGRLLHGGDQVTWWNDFNSDLITTYQSTAFSGKIANPGIFSNYCVEVAMQNLAVNTVALAQQLGLQDRQTAGLVTKANNNNNANKWESLDEMSQVKKAFEYVRKMVKLWIKQYEETESLWANELLKNFHRWITTQSGALYDPLLTRLTSELMKKVFHLLARRLQQLGLHIVHANYTKILVTTQKHTPTEARSCVEYALRKCVQENQKLFRYIGLTPCQQLYKALVLKDQFNFVSVLENGGFYYKLDITELMSPPIAKYFRLMLVTFVQKLAGLQQDLIQQFGQNRMQLFLDYDNLMIERLNQYIKSEFVQTMIEVLRKLQNDWQILKDKKKNQPATDLQESQQAEKQNIEKNSQHDQEENDSFINDGEDQSQQKQQSAPEAELMDFQWKDQSELESLIQNTYAFLNNSQPLRDVLHFARKNSILQLRKQPSLVYGLIKPIYPSFELPCSNCYLVNQQPGNCSHCDTPLVCTKELQRTVWKMMQQQGRDLYCNMCNRIKQDYLRKCGCGGKWILREFPLNWVKFTQRKGEEWNFVNEVFQFMGVS